MQVNQQDFQGQLVKDPTRYGLGKYKPQRVYLQGVHNKWGEKRKNTHIPSNHRKLPTVFLKCRSMDLCAFVPQFPLLCL